MRIGKLILLSLLGAGVLLGVVAFVGGGSHPLAPPQGLTRTASAEEYHFDEGSLVDSVELRRHSEYFPAFDEYLRTLPRGAAVLDLGCGNGSFLAHFADRGWKSVGVDFSPSGINIARKRFPTIRFEVLDATTDLSSVGYGEFDAVISAEVIEHIFLPRLYASNCFKLLKPGGMLVMTTAYHGYLKNLGLAVADRSYHGMRAPLWDFGHIKFWSVDTLSTLLFEAGFEQLEWRGLGRVPYLWKGLMMKAVVPQKK